MKDNGTVSLKDRLIQSVQIVIFGLLTLALTVLTVLELIPTKTKGLQVKECFEVASFAVEKFGQIDCLINNAGIMPTANFSDHKIALDAWEACIDTNLKGTLHGICAVYDQMMKQKRGQIINVASIWGNYPIMGNAVYQATKAGIIYLTESLRQETQGIIKTTVVRPSGCPGTELGGSKVVNNTRSNMVTDPIRMKQTVAGELGDGYKDANSPQYFLINPDDLTNGIIYALNQPWGVSISDITVRATGEFLTL